MKREEFVRLYSKGILSHIDIHFAELIARLDGRAAPELSLAAALASSATREGHVCFDLATVAGQILGGDDEGPKPLQCPPLAAWCSCLRESPLVGRPGEYAPLVLDGKNRIYLYRYWEYQEQLVSFIRERSSLADAHYERDGEETRTALDKLFPHQEGDEGVDWQKIAAFTALTRMFCVISGGPGTGKTMTIAKILALLLERHRESSMRIVLAAPTGKAANRLQAAVKEVKEKLDIPGVIKAKIPEEACTVHRLLGTIAGSPYFRHNRHNPLPLDILVIDEASMVDMALMAKLVQALPAHARLILLGDKDQLASVEAGAVLGDICDTKEKLNGAFNAFVSLQKRGQKNAEHDKTMDNKNLRESIVQLRKSYRFGHGSGIGMMSRFIRAGNDLMALRSLTEGHYPDIVYQNLPEAWKLWTALEEQVTEGFRDYLRFMHDPLKALKMFGSFRILGAVREGPFGVINLNAVVENILRRQGLLQTGSQWYEGRPVMITTNDYNLRLFNGDVGLILPDPAGTQKIQAFFPTSEGGVRKIHPFRLPSHETVFAMTVHKSQGSEFERIVFLLPEKDYPVLTRELLYTAITRAKRKVCICCSGEVFCSAIRRRNERRSGLRDALWEHV